MTLELAKDDSGTRRLVNRRRGELKGHVLVCPDGARRRVVVAHDAYACIECDHSRAARACTDAVHWLVLVPAADGGTLVVEAHVDEVRHIQRARLSTAEIRRYLGVEWERAA